MVAREFYWPRAVNRRCNVIISVIHLSVIPNVGIGHTSVREAPALDVLKIVFKPSSQFLNFNF